MTIIGTTWNPADVATGGGTQAPVFSNQNLTVRLNSPSGNNLAAGRTVSGFTTGKYYWEVTVDLIGGFTPTPGIVQKATALATFGATGGNWVGGLVWQNSGQVNRNGTGSVATWAAYVQGSVIAFAWDVVGGLIWGRVGAGGNWNNSAPANPATGVGGLTTAPLTGVMHPVFWFNDFSGSSSQVTANFGSSNFVGAVPAGFVAGVPNLGAFDGMFFNTQF